MEIEAGASSATQTGVGNAAVPRRNIINIAFQIGAVASTIISFVGDKKAKEKLDLRATCRLFNGVVKAGLQGVVVNASTPTDVLRRLLSLTQTAGDSSAGAGAHADAEVMGGSVWHATDLKLDGCIHLTGDMLSGMAAAWPFLRKLSFVRCLSKCEPQHLAQAVALNPLLEELHIYGSTLKGAFAEALADAVATPGSHLHTLYLDGSPLGAEGAAAIARGLQAHPTITTLSLLGCTLRNNEGSGMEHIAGLLLGDNRMLTTLDITSNGLTDVDAQALGAALQQNRCLTSLTMNANVIEDGGAIAIAQALVGEGGNNTLTTLRLARNQITAPGAAALGDALVTNTGLKMLQLDGNTIEGEGAAALGRALSSNHTLTELSLNTAGVDVDGVRGLAFGLSTNQALVSLKLGGNSLGSEGAKLLADGLMTNRTLTSLRLACNELTDAAAADVARVIGGPTGLQQLFLGGNVIGQTGAIAIADALRTNTTIRVLNLTLNSIDGPGARAIAVALRQNATLRELELDGNKLTDVGADAFVGAFEVNRTLRRLNVASADIKAAAGTRLGTAAKAVPGLVVRAAFNEGEKALVQAMQN